MRCIKTGKAPYSEPVKWNETLFVDIWGYYKLYTDCAGITLDYQLKEYIKSHDSSNGFNLEYIQKIIRGK